MTKKLLLPAMLASAALATGCASDGSLYRSDVYTAPMVNQAQEVKTVEIIAGGSGACCRHQQRQPHGCP